MVRHYGAGTLSHDGGRTGHAACQLADGSILVVGGSAFLRWLATVPNDEDGPFAGKLKGVLRLKWTEDGGHAWAPSSSMRMGRILFAAATLLDGNRVAVAGGFSSQNGRGETLASAEIYDAQKDAWSPLPRMRVPRDNVCGCVVQAGELRGCFVVIGGRHCPPGGDRPVALPAELYNKTCECLRPDGSHWEALPSMNIGRTGASCVAIGPHILVVGGFNSDNAASSSELYDPVRKQWLLLPKQAYSSAFRALVLGD